jgi:hypothetical protein
MSRRTKERKLLFSKHLSLPSSMATLYLSEAIVNLDSQTPQLHHRSNLSLKSLMLLAHKSSTYQYLP